MTTVAEPKKFTIEWQNKDENGNPIGTLQHFEADTQKELLEKVAASAQNAQIKMYDEMKKRKIGDLITPDPDTPVPTFERRNLSADDRVRLATAMKDPQTMVNATRELIEAEFGAPIDSLRQTLQGAEVRKRIDVANYQSELFADAHPEYYGCAGNKEMMLKWLEKHKDKNGNGLAITRKNLELAYEDLSGANGGPDLLAHEPKPAPISAATTTVATTEPAPAPTAAIPPAATTVPAITDPTTEVRPKQSSSGLGRGDSSAVPSAAAPKTPGITLREIAQMDSVTYQKRLQDPAFRKMVDELR